MKKLQNLILLSAITVTGAILPVSTASAASDRVLTNYVPILACRIFDTRRVNKSVANPNGQPVPFVVPEPNDPNSLRGQRSSTVWFDTKHYYINRFIPEQGGTASFDGKNVCDIPDDAVAININLSATSAKGDGDSWLRVWPYDGTLPAEADGATATVMSWNGTQLGNALPLTITPPDNGFHFTIRVFFKTPVDPNPANYSVHIIGDVLGYYVPVGATP